MKTPDTIFGQLFHDVQMSGIFSDSKTFVDCVPLFSPKRIIQSYEDQKNGSRFDLLKFVKDHFEVPGVHEGNLTLPHFEDVTEHIEFLWNLLSRSAIEPPNGSSLISLPAPYIVPGGRFREIYYWDSYFTMLGLLDSDRADIVANMVENFGSMIDRLGHIPNGSRSYFISRSQPPFYPLMVKLLADHEQRQITGDEYTRISREYDYWMNTSRGRCVVTGECKLNRYWDELPIPRQESYKEDVELGESAGRESRELFLDIRAACESGWDFSSRWFTDENDLSTIRTSDLLPVDLNSLMYINEQILCTDDSVRRFQAIKQNSILRGRAINDLFWNDSTGVYSDYCISSKAATDKITMAAFFPLYAEVATQEKAKSTVEVLEGLLLRDGGWLTTGVNSGQQWDSPNGWAPLQWIAYVSLNKYGFNDLAREGARRWVDNCIRVFGNTGKLVEKYNVIDTTLEAGGGEYPVQDGFGWTNGVLLRLMRELGY